MGTTVLVVEDDQDLLFLYKTALEGRGYVVIGVRNADDAIELLREQIPALIVLDIELPGTPGTGVITFIRQEERLHNTRVVVVTANDKYQERLADAIDGFLTKPIAITNLISLAETLTASAR